VLHLATRPRRDSRLFWAARAGSAAPGPDTMARRAVFNHSAPAQHKTRPRAAHARTMAEVINKHSTVPAELNGQRFDQIAAQLFPDYSRARLQAWIKNGELTVDGAPGRARDKLA